jgi:MFS transporter, ACS family, hexuronate transporter
MTSRLEAKQAVLASSLPLSATFLAVMTMGYAVYATDRTVLSSVLAPLSTSLGLSNSQIGLLSAAQYIGVFCTVFLAGHLSDRIGRWRVMITGIIIFTAFTWLIGLAASFLTAFTFRLISGFGEGMFWPVAMASVANVFGRRKGLSLGIFYVGFDIGSVAGLSIGGFTFAVFNDWRPAFFIAPLLGLFVITGALLTRRRLPRAGDGVAGLRIGRDALQLLENRNVLLIMIFALLATWSSVWQVVFLPYYIFTVMKFTILTSALLSALVAVSGALGKVTIGGLSDSVRRQALLVIVSVLTLLSYGLFFASYSLTLDLVGAVSMGFFSAAIFPIMQALMTENSEGKLGSALGLSTTSQSVATIFSPIIAASLFSFGVGRAVALDSMIPIGLAIIVALAIGSGNKRSLSEPFRY